MLANPVSADLFCDSVAAHFVQTFEEYFALLRSRGKQDERTTAMFCKHFRCPNLFGYFSKSDYLYCPLCEHNRAGNKYLYKYHLFKSSSFQRSCESGFGGMKASKENYFMKRPQEQSTKQKGKWQCPDKEFLKLYPSIAAYLCDDVWEDGKAREVSVLSINFSQGCCSISLADKDLEQSCYTTSKSLQDALQELEQALAADKVTWRAWKTKTRK